MEKEQLLKGKKILIVDDEPDILEALEELLSMCQVEKAASFNEAQKKLNTLSFDIAILDIMGVHGYRLLDLTKEKKIISVMLTAHAFSPDDTIKAHKKGAAYYLPKEEMVNIVRRLDDVLQAHKKNKNTWWNWFDKFASLYDSKFGADWRDKDKEFWERLNYL